MLRPELQDEAVFADSVDIIVTTHKVVAEHYRADAPSSGRAAAAACWRS